MARVTPAAERLLVVRRGGEELAHSPEFQYLRSWNLGEIEAVFGAPAILDDPAGGDPVVDQDCSHVLLLADPNVLLGRRSVAAMRRRLEEGCDVACPALLADALAALPVPAAADPVQAGAAGLTSAAGPTDTAVPPPGREPVYTLLGFERVEEAILARQGQGVETPGSHLPVSLWRSSALRAAAPDLAWGGLLAAGSAAGGSAAAGTAVPAELAPGLRRGLAGVYHRFVDYYAEVRDDILPFVPAGVREVLEIGCGRGATGKLLQERFGCRVTGVELNPVVAREAARHLHAVLAGDVETLAIPGRYDLIVALELFEHLTRQEEFLARMRALLEPGGTILLSVPNVGHHAVVEDLLAGRWDYLPIGLLCYTHYRFFTRATLESWFHRCGFPHPRLVPQPTELPGRFAALARDGPFELDLESLGTKGFYVLLGD
ncbi:MAG TPA: class I SAM-dependent methyltransferase [Thermoanaerobaculia bacterium]|nr:class I SAM-dependent methyltransferase [Thermoanaerobaculia bacterium]